MTTGWWNSFRKRHPQLTVRVASRLSYVRAVAHDPEIFQGYFDLLEEALSKNKLMNDPVHIFNCDESGFPLEHKPGKLIGMRGQKDLHTTTSGDKAQLTVLACVSASGYPLPLLIIFGRKRLKPELTEGQIPGTIYGLSDNGWIDSEIFEQWFEKHFLTHVPPIRPLMLLLDGHSSHYQPSLVKKASENDIILFCLPPHTTHLAQPLDRTCFSPLKKAWNEECRLYMAVNPGKKVNRYNFTEIFAKAWRKVMTPSNIASGFRATGVCPFNRSAIKIPGIGDATEEPSALLKTTRLAFIPLFSPAHPQKPKTDGNIDKPFTDKEKTMFPNSL